MTSGCLKGLVALAILAGWQTAAPAYPVTSPTTSALRVSTFRFEPMTRPGGIPGAPRETTPFWQNEPGSGLTATPTVKEKRRRH